ncbi:hypothetical protein HDU87_007267 [Geranomyces variabilis]|uniref:Uncharacterized protein n=1 Tax=Geranomyces variabilis TaxID=109894 RepID=A0AAD5TE81_9FUNG|nr:hypothetical protein HDU87_007267 [Geranomyces variabilis]
MSCGSRICEFHHTLFDNDVLQVRCYKEELDLSYPNRRQDRPCTKTSDCRCYVCSWAKVGERPMFELDERMEPWSLDRKHLFICVQPGDNDSPIAGQYNYMPNWCKDVTSRQYRNARLRYVQHPYPMTDFEKIWHIRPLRCYYNMSYGAGPEWDEVSDNRCHYDPALFSADDEAGYAGGKPVRYVTAAVQNIIDFDLINGARKVFPMRIHSSAAEGCFTVRHRRPSTDNSTEYISRLAGVSQYGPYPDVVCVDRELIRNFRPHADLPSVEGLTQMRGVQNHPQFLWNIAEEEDAYQADDENADDSEDEDEDRTEAEVLTE